MSPLYTAQYKHQEAVPLEAFLHNSTLLLLWHLALYLPCEATNDYNRQFREKLMNIPADFYSTLTFMQFYIKEE